MTTTTVTRPANDSSWTEPESAANTDYQPVYPYNHVTATESGHAFEMDDTPTRERIRLSHRSGTFIEMHPNGDEVHKVYGDGYEITIGGKNVLIKGTCNIEIDGDANINILKDLNMQVGGNYTLDVAGNMFVHARGSDGMHLSSDSDMEIAVGSASPTSLGGSLRLNTGANAFVSGDLHVAGSITGDIITAESRLGTGPTGGVSAGLAGFTTPTGGISVGVPAGFPVAVPGCINAIGIITSAASVVAPTGTFGIMSAVTMTDVVNTHLYDTHTHPAPNGITGTPTNIMV